MSLPVTVVGGYLGAGKTTLINHALRHAEGQRLAVLVNEFGALPIDEDLITAEEDGIISIAGGCICCSFGDDLMGALMDLAGMDPAPDHILIEASGVAIPSSIAASLSLLQGFALGGIVVLVDCDAVLGQARDAYIGDTITRQLTDADLVLVTKPDIVDAAQRAEVLAWLAQQAPKAQPVLSVAGQVPLEVLLGPRASDDAPRMLPHSDRDYDSALFHPKAGSDPSHVAQGLAEGGLGVLRAKGFVGGSAGQAALVQVVGKRWQVTPAEPGDKNGVICIGLKGQFDRAGIAALIER